MSGSGNQGADLNKDSYFLLNDGRKMPVVALGTFNPDLFPDDLATLTTNLVGRVNTEDVEKAIKTAIDVGFCLVDTAYVYLLENGVGRAFKDLFSTGKIKREDVFCSTKLWNTYHKANLVRPALERSLADLQLDYVDLYLMHFPLCFKEGDHLFPSDEKGQVLYENVDLGETWEAMEQLKEAGLAKSIGVSNFNIQQLKKILNKPGLLHKPAVNQVECHPYLNQREMLEFCKSNGIVLMAYGGLGSPQTRNWVDQTLPKLVDDPILIEIGKKYGKSPAQVAIRYNIQRRCVPIVKSFNPDHIRENFQALEFQLSPIDMETIDKLDRNGRYWKFTMYVDIENHISKQSNEVVLIGRIAV